MIVYKLYVKEYKDLITITQAGILEGNRWSTMSVNR
jgi:hypothetical protein